jgi:sugar phosphate isomerase/epimerase
MGGGPKVSPMDLKSQVQPAAVQTGKLRKQSIHQLDKLGVVMNISRRDMLRLGAGAAAVMAAGVHVHGAESAKTAEPAAKPAEAAKPAAAGAKEIKKIPIGLQLYSLRSTTSPQSNPATFKALAEMGYQGVEFWGGKAYMSPKAEDLRKMLDDSKLVCCGAHTDLNLLQGDQFKTTIEFNKILGNKKIIIPSLPGNALNSEENIKNTAKLLTEISDKAKADGIRVGYHAHDADFRKIGDLTTWEILFNACGLDVIAQIDLGHCMTGGGDPVEMLNKFANRAASVHITDGRRAAAGSRGGGGTLLGQGDVKWDEIFKIINEAGKTDWLIVEQETYVDKDGKQITPMESVKLDIDFLKKLGR